MLQKSNNHNQSQMELLRTALVIIFFTTVAAKPFGWRHHKFRQDRLPGWLGRHHFGSRLFNKPSGCDDSSSESDQSPESSESSESQSSESSEEVPIPDQTTVVMTTTTMTTIAEEEEGSAFTPDTPEPDTKSTDEPTVDVTPSPATPTTPVGTTTCNVTQCVTVEIPTEGPSTDNRGDN